jgi:hypothetical protein
LTYREQIVCTMSALRDHAAAPLPSGLVMTSSDGSGREEDWIDLLNQDSGFGLWNRDRLEREIRSRLFASDAVQLVFSGSRLVAAVAVVSTEFRGRAMPSGTFLIVAPGWRGNFALARALVHAVQDVAARCGERELLISTFPDRLTPLALYLSIGVRPVWVALSSPLQWRRVLHRLGPTVERMRRRRS